MAGAVTREGFAMTYPAQPGQPYGQQGHYGQGGHPQGGQYPRFASPQGGGSGGPPNRNRTGLWIGLSAGFVVVVFLITALVAPGFLLGDDERGDGGTGGASGGSGATALAQQIVAGFNNHDTSALTELTCADADPDVDEVIMVVSTVDNATLGTVTESGSTATAGARVVVSGQTMDTTAKLVKTGQTWCWQNLSIGSAANTGSEPSR